MHIYYRISDVGYKKVKAPYINNENCLKNFCVNFLNGDTSQITVIADNVCIATWGMITTYVHPDKIVPCSLGSGAQTFNLALDMALKSHKDDEIIYFVENDYIHRKNSKQVMEEGFELGADFCTLYNHPDKFIPAKNGGNAYVEDDGGYITKIYKGKNTFWYLPESTTFTWAAKVKTLKSVNPILRKWTIGTYPQDFRMFCELRELGYSLMSPFKSYSTHGEVSWLASLIGTEYENLLEIDGWEKIINE